jgi:spermidine synthase
MRTAAATPAIEIALAWILATSPEPELRRGAEAVALAERAVAGTGRRDARALDTLAAAYAAAGRFAEARAAAAEALSRSRAAGDERHAPDIAARLALYERGESFLVAGRAQDGEAGAGREPAAP